MKRVNLRRGILCFINWGIKKKVDETPVIQSKVIFFCTVPKLAMKNTLLDQMQLMAVTALGRMVRCTLVQGERAITK